MRFRHRAPALSALAIAAATIGLTSLPSPADAAPASTKVTTQTVVTAQGVPQAAYYTYQAPGGESTRGQKVIALTFDDGPGPYTPQVLSILEQYHVPGSFFELGVQVSEYPQYTRMVAAAGYPVEDHSWSHPDLRTIPTSQFSIQVDQTQSLIHSLTGRTPECVRPPYDAFNSTVLDQIAKRGLTTMSYSIDPRDWALPGVTAIVNNVVGAAHPGAVVVMHDAGGPRQQTVAALPRIITELRAQGYTFVSICGPSTPAPTLGGSAVYRFGNTPPVGASVVSTHPFVASAATPTGRGYWLVASDGGIFSFGDARFHGSTGAMALTKPIVGMAATSTGRGYWLVASDGGIFSFGDAQFHGSTGAMALTKPIVGMAATSTGRGYWLVASDGGIFSFGDAQFHGSTGAMALTRPIVGMAATSTGRGYWLVASDGGVFSFGDARFHGSTGAMALTRPIVGMAATSTGRGYWLVASDGGVFAFGAPFYGSAGARAAGVTFFGIVAIAGGRGYLLAGNRSA